MKTRILGEKFTPITIEIAFESRAEVVNFYARTNAPNGLVESAVPDGEYYDNGADDIFDIADECYKMCK